MIDYRRGVLKISDLEMAWARRRVTLGPAFSQNHISQ